MLHVITMFHSLPGWARSLGARLVGFMLKNGLKGINTFLYWRLGKKVQPLRDIAAQNPSLSAWAAEPGSKNHRMYEQMVKTKLMIRSPYVPGQYMLPTRWH